MVYVVLVVIAATAIGVIAQRRLDNASVAARGALSLMLYVLVPFVSFVNIAHLHLTAGAGAGLGFAYLAIGTAGLLAWAIGRGPLALERPALGSLICSVILVNTGYLGLPMTVALLGSHELAPAIAYDQLVTGPMLFLFGFGLGAAFGERGGQDGQRRLASFITRNPPLLAVIAGLIAPASAAPAVLVRASHVVVAALLPLGFFAVGVTLATERRAEAAPLVERPDRPVTAAVVLRLVCPPALLAAFSATIVHLPTAYVLMAAMPTAVNTLIVGQAYGLRQRPIATAIVWSTTLVIVIGALIAI